MDSTITTIVNDRLELYRGGVTLGKSSAYNWIDDPSRLMFSLARYKFVSRLLENTGQVLEVGCGDGFGTYLVSKFVNELTGIDNDEDLIKSASKSVGQYNEKNLKFLCIDAFNLNTQFNKKFDAIYSLDVIEHIRPDFENDFLSSLTSVLSENGVLVIGAPSLESQTYASPLSKIGHINCKTKDEFKRSLQAHFRNVFLFGMNDEMIGTGYGPMNHYRIALCVGLKR
jgi:2-polyprenyl-3-methyl-5-hydroxy-6-metoxy-1,4-benzoquinol methylase